MKLDSRGILPQIEQTIVVCFHSVHSGHLFADWFNIERPDRGHFSGPQLQAPRGCPGFLREGDKYVLFPRIFVRFKWEFVADNVLHARHGSCNLHNDFLNKIILILPEYRVLF